MTSQNVNYSINKIIQWHCLDNNLSQQAVPSVKRVITMKLILSFHFNRLESKVTHELDLNRVISWLGVCTLTRNHINYKDKKIRPDIKAAHLKTPEQEKIH